MTPIINMAIVALALALPGSLSAQTASLPSEVTAGENGWENYVAPPMIDSASARDLTPDLSTPEGAVTLFLASRLRGDKDWRGAMVSSPDRKAKKALKQWKSWTLNEAQLKARKLKPSRGYVRVWMDFTIDGDTDSGTDDFTVTQEGDEWRVVSPPS